MVFFFKQNNGGRHPPPALHSGTAQSNVLAFAPFALVLADARPPALLAFAPFALVLADARAPALLACAFCAGVGRKRAAGGEQRGAL